MTSSPQASSSSSTMSSSAMLWLIIWMLNNIGVTLLNKAAFQTVDFKYPYFLSAVHMLCNWAGAQMIFASLQRQKNQIDNGKCLEDTSLVTRLLGTVQRQQMDWHAYKLIMAFSVIFSLNIAIGNVSLKYVSVNFNQVMRSLVPALTIGMGLLLRKKISAQRQWAVVPVVAGVAMACFGDMSYTAIGLCYTLLCVFLAALKVVASGEMLTGALKLHPVDLLGHMAPLAFAQCIIGSFLVGEVSEISSRWATELSPMVNFSPLFVVLLSGIMSFSLNICSLQANKLTSPLTLCIAANVKQVLMIVLSTLLFHVEITPLNGAGIVVVLAGSARYSYVCLMEKEQGGGKNESMVEMEKKEQDETEAESDTESEDSDLEEQRSLISHESLSASSQSSSEKQLA